MRSVNHGGGTVAMSKEEQREAAKRIMAKLGPLDEVEMEAYKRFTTEPENYPKADRDFRVCQECGEEFRTVMEKGQEGLTAMQQFADHTTKHNPLPGKWSEAHQRIRVARENKKQQDTQ